MALALAALAAVASASVGVTLALYSNKPTGETNTFAAGTVSVGNVVTGACTASTSTANNMAPGRHGELHSSDDLWRDIVGYMGLDVFIATKSNAAGTPTPIALYDGTSNGAEITVSSTSPTVSYVTGATSFGTAIACPNSTTSLDGNTYSGSTYVCYLLSNFLVQTTAFSSGTVTFTTGVALPSTEPNGYQGGSVVVVLAAHVVQSKNNAINCAAGGVSPSAGAVCTPAGSFAWS